MENDKKKFLNDKFWVLNAICEECLYSPATQFPVKVSVTQRQLAKETGISRTTVNKILATLEEDGYVKLVGYGEYLLMAEGVAIVEELWQGIDAESIFRK